MAFSVVYWLTFGLFRRGSGSVKLRASVTHITDKTVGLSDHVVANKDERWGANKVSILY